MFVLKNHERLIIDRRRRGENQTQAAKRWAVSQAVYSLWERNKHNHIPHVTELFQKEPADDFGELFKHEIAFIKRRREGLMQWEAANRLGCSEEWYKRMERGEVNGKSLFEYWGI